MKVEKIPVCVPIQKLILVLKDKSYEIKESKVSDFHFHELYFMMESNVKSNLEDIIINKINKITPTKFSCTCHWSIVEVKEVSSNVLSEVN